jgi:hypothetical protein
MKARVWLTGSVLLVLFPLACADVLGLEPGVLAQGGSSGSGGNDSVGGVQNVGGEGAGADVGGSASSGSAHLGGATATGSAGETEQGGAAAAGAPSLPEGGEPNTGPCHNGTCTECPTGMKQAYSKDAFFYCIDAAEVTNEEYSAFAERYTVKSVIASTACGNNATLIPDPDCSTALTDVPSRKLPVVCVDYCDAEAYCNMHGKRLCGRVGGSMNDPSDIADPAADEWYAACAGPGETLYPYGDAASASACNGSGYAPADPGPRDVATLSDCEGGLPGLYNMSGNVAEWEWACSSTSATATCETRGGSYNDGPYELRCGGTIALGRMEASETVGFRCCANLKN